ncbi:MAG TPA: MarR family winged helix-turn-helix transcriptional regulator [Acidimicrobiales bacterium]
MRASRGLVAIAARSLVDVEDDVTLAQYRAIVVLCRTGTGTMKQLAEELECSPSAATRLCDRLVARGLIERVNPATDRRQVQVAATAAGRRLVRAVTRRRRIAIDRILQEVPQAQQVALVDALTAFAAAVGEAPSQAWAAGWDL